VHSFEQLIKDAFVQLRWAKPVQWARNHTLWRAFASSGSWSDRSIPVGSSSATTTARHVTHAATRAEKLAGRIWGSHARNDMVAMARLRESNSRGDGGIRGGFEYLENATTRAEQLLSCPNVRLLTECLSPIIYQSWYDLFLPPWHHKQLHVVFSEDFFNHPQRTLSRLLAYLDLPPAAFDVSYVRNHHDARGIGIGAIDDNRMAASTATATVCLNHSDQVLTHAYALMDASIRSTREQLAPLGYSLPASWSSPPASCGAARAKPAP
jgi:hypothetical protein